MNCIFCHLLDLVAVSHSCHLFSGSWRWAMNWLLVKKTPVAALAQPIILLSGMYYLYHYDRHCKSCLQSPRLDSLTVIYNSYIALK